MTSQDTEFPILTVHAYNFQTMGLNISLIPRPYTLKEGKGSGDIGEFSRSCVPSYVPIQIYAISHMITELSEPRISSNVTRHFPHARGWVWE